MSIAEIKSEAESMSPEEILHLAAYFHHLARRRSPEYLQELDDAWTLGESGDRVSLEDLKRLDADLRKKNV